MATEVPQFAGLSWAKIGDLGVQLETRNNLSEGTLVKA